ncbi:non-ribosomal peptide synthetase [Breoghania sp.]|uniref:non-ribosomal peptide synthetase n=1 Tax=Breoghania sp. TaxID=2065378 RepID=UPI0029CA6FF2|nr:non-ribosomal peptide synthetase [Breoghania sp.]
MSDAPRDSLRARMAQILDRELVERAAARVAARAEAEKSAKKTPDDRADARPQTPLSERLSRDVWQIAASALRMPKEELDPQENLANLGVDSIAITEIMVQISRHFAISVAPTTFFEAQHLDDLSEILLARYGKSIEAHYDKLEQGKAPEPEPKSDPESDLAPVREPVAEPKEEPGPHSPAASAPPASWLRRHRAVSARSAAPAPRAVEPAQSAVGGPDTHDAPIAILSVEGMFPKSPDLETFAAHLAAGDDCMEEIPPERWDWRTVFGDPKKGAFTDVRFGGFVPGADMFDAGFFNISPREAELMDPQHRLFMECVWSLIEKGGYAPGSLAGRKVGLFLGINLIDYTVMVNRADIMEAQQLTGLGHSFCPNRISFLLDIHGPSEVVDTACSSSLVAIHRGVMSIRHEGCDMAIAGGSNLMLSPLQHIMFSKVGMISPDGRCKTFSKDANGYARSDGVGAVLLKRLDLAERDGDPILGVIRGSVEHHGGGATSLTAPNPKAQAALIVAAHRQAGTDPRTIGLVECHGTGTRLGDPIEVEGLKLAFSELYRDHGLEPPETPVTGIGSVKSNIGHTEASAGIAGLIKVVLALKSATLFRSLHCDEPNPLLEFEASPLYLLQSAASWKRPVIDGREQPRRAGLSSFGAGGTNVHLVIEEYRPLQARAPCAAQGPVVVPVSAKNAGALKEAIARLKDAARDADSASLAYTLQIGRDAMRYRAAFIADGTDDLIGKMEAYLSGGENAAICGTIKPGQRDRVETLHPRGQEPEVIARHWAMGGEVNWAELYGETRPPRIALPAYPFQRKRYWLPELETATGRDGLDPSVQGAGAFVLTVTGHEAFLADHKVAGVPVLPGVAYLELARAAAAKAGIANPVLRKVVWMAQLKVEGPTRITCEIMRPGEGDARAEIFTQMPGGERRVHAQMKIAAGDVTQDPPRDLDALRNRPARHLSGAQVYAAFDAMGLTYGPSHRLIADLAISSDAAGEAQVLAKLVLPELLRATLSDFVLHPGLMDGALQSAVGLALDEDGEAPKAAALPFSIESVESRGPLEAQMWANVRIRERTASGLMRMDIDLLAEDGSPRVRLAGFTTRALEQSVPTGADGPEALRFEPHWRAFAPAAPPEIPARHIVLLASGAGDANALKTALPDADIRALDDDPAAPLDARFHRLAEQLLVIGQAELSSASALIQLVLTDAPDTAPLAALAAMMRSMGREHPKLSGQLLLVPEGDDLAPLLKTAASAPAGACLKAEGAGLMMEVWEEVASAPEPASRPWRADGVYLITGGTGALGRALAGRILENAPGATVVLASRSTAEGDVASWIAETTGLHHIRADVSDKASVENLVREIRETHGKLDGVIHTAGVIRDEAFARKTGEQLAAVLAPKVSGAVALDAAIGDAPLDFLAFYSSISGVVGNIGQADYAAANAFLDAFAQARETRRLAGKCHGVTRSIAWPLWRDGGMRIDAAQEDLMRRTTGLVPMETDTGLDALCAALAGPASRVAVTPGDPARIRRFVGGAFEVKPQATGGPQAASVRKPADPDRLRRPVLKALLEAASAQLKVLPDDIDVDVELTEYGFDSIGFTQFANRLNDLFDLELTPTLFFEYPVLEGLAGYLAEEETVAMAAALGLETDAEAEAEDAAVTPEPAPAPEPVQPVTASVPNAVQASATLSDDPIAIIGMSSQFPGAPDVEAFWEVLKEGRNCICEIPSDRWDWRDYWGDPVSEPGKGNVKWGGFISDIGAFDAAFFGISPPEARMMDPQQRLLLTESWRVMEDAGYAPSALAGSRTGVFVGTADMGYSRLVAQAGVNIEGYAMTGLAPSLGPNRISYFYDLHGPSVAVETACSSALIAVHRAAEAIRAGHCTQAIAGGINALLLPDTFVGFAKAGMLSPKGQCQTFSAQADGYARGEGVGLVFLKSLSAAERDGDRILGVIRSSAENHGGHAATLTAPNPKAQADLIRDAYRRAAIDPRTVGYIEAHGTGTPLGDPIEVEALTAAFADLDREAEARFGPAPAHNCALGSVKSNIGHLELAAGLAGLIKVLLQMHHGEIAKSLHAEELNPYLKLKGSPFHVAQVGETWPRPRDAQGKTLPRRAGVSSFGFGGTNAHVVVEEYVPPAPSTSATPANDPDLIVLSARSQAQLKQMAGELRAFLQRPDQTAALCDIACTLQTAREPMEFRLGFKAETREEMLDRLGAYMADKDSEALHTGRVKPNRRTNAVLETDAPLREAAAGLAERGRADDLLTLWAGGLSIDWASVRKGRPGKRIALPGYPFAKTRYWVGAGPSAPVAPVVPVEPAAPAASQREPVASLPDVTPETRLARTLERVTEIAASTLEVDPAILDVDTELGDFGFDSVTMTAFASQINSGLGLSLSPADFFEFATLQRLAAHIAPDLSDAKLGLDGQTSATPPPVAAARTQPEPRVQSRPIDADDDPIVIVGHSCTFPMAADADEFWENLITGRDCISRIPPDRWSWQAFDGDPRREPGKTNIHWGGFIDGVFAFDPLAFGISPREARLMDPQQRLMLTHAWKAIEDAGHAPESLAGKRVGIFVGTSSSGYREMIGEDSGGEGYIATGSVPSVGPNRISYLLDLHGPSEPVETACSSSLVALHRAVQAIRAGDCDMALVGGVNTIITPEAHISFAKAGMLSSDGRCKTFSADANGYVRGEGVGMLFVRRLSDARRDGDPILAVVRATAINHGGHANSLTAPNTQAQADLLIDAYTQAGIDQRTVGYIEAHGTGTALGDPVEINALKSAFRSLPKSDVRLEETGCALGSVKTNIGHLELAAGVAGVIKVLKQFEHHMLAPSLHCAAVNPYIDLAESPFRIQREAAEWRPVRDENGNPLPLRAGISSFGFGGVNAHAILEEYRPDEAPAPQRSPRGPVVVTLSARTPERLREAAENLLAEIDRGRIAPADMADLAFTLQVGRSQRAERLAIVATDPEDLRAALARYLAGEASPDIFTGTASKSVPAALRPDASLEEIAGHWVKGGHVDWQTLDPAPHRRLRLPTTPFARDVYRAGPAPAASEPPATEADIRLHADAFYLKDHVVRAKPILPGAMSLELVCRAALARDCAGPLPLALSGVTWRRPIELAAGTLDLTVALEDRGSGCHAFRLRPVAEGQADFMRGVVRAADDAQPAPLDIAALQAACHRSHDPDWLYASYSALGIDYGPAMRAIVDLQSGDGEVLARLAVPRAAQRAGGGETFTLHPSLIDGAFQAALVAFTQDGDSALALPYGIDRVTVFEPTDETMWAHLRVRPAGEGLRKLDIVLADETGKICASIEGFSVRLMPGAREDVAPSKPADAATVERYFIDLIARETEIDAATISLTAQLEDYGIDSVLIMQLTDVLERDFGPLPKTLFFEHQTLGALIGYFRETHGTRLAEICGGAAPQSPAIPAPVTAKAPADAVRRGREARDEPIAIIGLAGRYPGARNVEEFWQNLAAGRDSVTEVPATRWDHARYYDPERQIGKTTCRHGGFIAGHDRFDPMFFNISPREARFLDPQERLFLQCAWETLEDAGYTRETVAPGGDVGVFAGVMWEEYQLYTAELNARGIPAALAGSAAAIANRVSHFFNFHGPSIALDTMCSSSLTAIHLASEALRSGDCSVALAGGVNLTTHPNKYCALSQGRFLSVNGRCEAFGAGGDGYVPAEGVGAVLLKPLSKAEADGDRIHGVILACALNHGGKTNGFTVPNPLAQTAVIEKACHRAGIALSDVSYIEAHGTGTSLGDPIEIAALTRAFEARGETAAPCAIGSVKSNIGHAESAAGMAGLTKILLQMRHGQLAPSLHAEVLNPNIDFAGSPFRVQQKLEPWTSDGPRIAGLSSFGAGGSNAHLVIAQYQETAQPVATLEPTVFPVSARDPERLTALLQNLRAHLDTVDERDLPRIAFTLQEGREAFEERLAIIAGSLQSLKEGLDHALRGEASETTFRARAAKPGARLASSETLRDIAAGWVMGAAVDWQALRKGPKPRPISLPGYPFAEEVHWLPVMEGAPACAAAPACPKEPLPLLYAPDWRARDIQPTGEAAKPLHVLVACDAACPTLADDLRRAGGEVALLEASGTSPAERYSGLAWVLLERLKDLARKKEPRTVQVVVPLSGDNGLLEGLSGLLRSASLEHPFLACKLIAVEDGLPGLARHLEVEAGAAKDQSEIRYIDGARLVRHWREITPATPAPTSAPWKENGVYLLTGGAGGIGLHVADAIAASGCKPSLWLTGRSALKPEAEATLKGLEGHGARVRYRRIDVTDGDAVAALIDEIRQIDGALTGVFHGAGVTRDGLLLSKTAGAFTQVLAPKVTGVQCLDHAIGDAPLDFLVLFASAAGALGNPGQTDYAAANACLDAFAAQRNAMVEAGTRHGHTVSIDWPYWRDGGMSMDDRTIAALARTAGVTPLETAPGIAALKAILAAGDEAQVLVLEGDHDRLRDQMKSLQAPAAKPVSKPVTAAAPEPVKRSDPVPAAEDRDATIAAIRAGFSDALGIPQDRLGLDDTIDRFGVDSVLGLEIVEALEARFGALPPTILFEFPTINRLADELAGKLRAGAAPQAPQPVAPSGPVRSTPVQSAPEPDPTLRPASAPETSDIAIIAVAGRFPDADTVERFAELLRQGHDFITEIPADRPDLVPVYSPRKGEPGASHCKWGAFLSNVDSFDAEFFGFTPRAADLSDPQERLFLETTWHLFERAGHTRDWLAEHYERRVGVFVGSMYNQYPGLATEPDARALLSLSSYAGIANRTSFFFDLQGPSVAVDSMCSSGLQAVHQAVQSLRAGECRLAVAGGVNLSIHPAKYEALSRGGLVAADPEARAFSGGVGYLPAEAVGAVLLKPVADALADGDRILAVIKGSLANHAGHSAGYAVPSVDAQERLLADSFRMANVDPASISYIEAAATGSQIGDAIELRALSSLYLNVADAHPAIGSVKANMGHAEGASGLAQLVKVLAQFEHQELYPSLVKPGASDAFRGTGLRPLAELTPWTPPQGAPRRAMISSFGAGGSNVHLILEEAPDVRAPTAGDEPALPRLFPVSARDEDRLRALRFALAAHLKTHPDISLEVLSRTLRFGRESFECEILLAAESLQELIDKLEDQAYRETGDALAAAARSPEISRQGPMLVLPGYPFKRTRHWLKTTPVEAPPAAPASAADMPGGETPLAFICKVLAGELGRPVESVAPDADLEHLGVDSMARMRLVYALEEAYGVSLTAQDMEDHPTPARLAGLLAGALPAIDAAPVAAEIESRPATANPIRRAAPERRPLGEAQKGLWVLHSLYPQSGDYNVPSAYLCRNIDRAALAKALEWLLNEYPILATRLEEGEGEPVLVARADGPEIQPVTLSKELERDAFLRQRALIPFDLAKGVFRVESITGDRLEPGTSVLLFVAHHIVTDGVSAALISGDFWQAYDHFAKGARAPKPNPLAADYAEFVEWETGFAASEDGRLQKAWWLEKLAGPLPDLRLPVISGARRKRERAGDSQELRLSQDLTDRLADLARELGTSQASLHLTAFAALLYRYTGERDLVIGVPTLRRPARRFAETLGFCANMIGFRHELDPALEVRLLATRIHAELGEALAHGDYPFAGIARELGGTVSGEAPYQVTFAYQSFGAEHSAIESVAKGDVRLLDQIRQSGDTPFGIEVQNDAQGALIIANYDANAFARGTMGRMLQHYRMLLQALAEGASEPVSTLPMMTQSEMERALHHWSHERLVETVQIPVHDLILARARQMPGALAVSGAQGALTYKRLAARIRQIVQLLEKRGVKPGEKVGVFLGRTPDSIAALLAVLASGGVWVPLDPEHPDERLSFIVRDAGLRVVLSDTAHADRLKGLKTPPAHVIDLDRERPGLRSRFAQVSLGEIRLGDPAYVIYTSGSTGAPKGVVVSHGALSRHCQIVGREYGISESDVALQFAPASVDTALEQMLPILIAGGRLELRPEGLQGPEAFHHYLSEKAVTVADLPPVYLHELLRAWASRKPEARPLALRLVIVGGEALTGDVVEAWARSPLADLRLINAYGPTEATITALIHDVKPADRGSDAPMGVPIGRPLAGVEIYILDENGNLVPDGIVGELHLGGDRLAIGYLGRPVLTEEKFATHRIGGREIRLYATGDLACFRPNSGGLVEFRGRIDDQVKIRGHRIELGEVEAALAACGLAEAAVLVERNRVGDPVLTAYLALPQTDIAMADVKARLAEMLPAHMVPSIWVRLDRLPKTISGKIDRQALRRQETAIRKESGETRAPRDRLEEHLHAIWTEALGRPTDDGGLGIDEDFSLAGGNSLLTVRLLGRIHQVFGASLSVADLAGAGTIASQARLLRRRGISAPLTNRAGATTRSSLIVSLRQPERMAGNGAPEAPPLFLIHPVAGTLSCYRPLLEALTFEAPVFGLRAAGLEPGETPQTDSLEALAGQYLRQVLKVQRSGPYRLCGWSLGGVIAYEMARQLKEAGEEVSFLGLIDSYTPADIIGAEDGEGRTSADLDLACRQAFVCDLFGVDVALAPDQDVVRFVHALPQFDVVFPGGTEAEVHRLLDVFSANFRLVRSYDPPRSALPITLVRATDGLDSDFVEGWTALSSLPLRVRRVAADHYSVLRQPALADWLPEFSKELMADPV